MTGTPARHRGEIRASNPCSEYMFLDDTACNLASLNLLQFRDQTTGKFDIASFEHAVRLWTIVLEVSVMMAQFPSKEIARLSYEFRTLGLGFANIGGLLMTAGIPYDSHEGRAICAAISAIMTGDLLCDLGRNGQGAWPLRRLCQEPRAHAAGDAQPSPCRLWRCRRLRSSAHRAGAARRH